MDSRYARPDFIHHAGALGLDTVARVPNNPKIWHFKGKYKTLQSLYDHRHKSRRKHAGRHGKIRYRYFDLIVEHPLLGKVKPLFLHTGKALLIFIGTDLSLSGKAMIETCKKRWNIEQGYKDLFVCGAACVTKPGSAPRPRRRWERNALRRSGRPG